MWFNGDYRVVFRYEDFEKFVDEYDWYQKIDRAISRMQNVGLMPEILSCRAFAEVEKITVAVLQKQIQSHGLKAWHTFTVGYAFCQLRDQFSKKTGRKIAFERALGQIPNGIHKGALRKIYIERIEKPEQERKQAMLERVEQIKKRKEISKK
jgi:hypothetical protein